MSAECSEVRMAQSAAEIAACYHVMKQLRQDQPCMADAAAFTSTVQRMQQQEGFCLAYLVQPNTDRVVAVAGYRIGESLFNGKQLYVQGKPHAALCLWLVTGCLCTTYLGRLSKNCQPHQNM